MRACPAPAVFQRGLSCTIFITVWLLPVTGTSACGGSLLFLFPPHPNSVRKCAALTKQPVRPLPRPTTHTVASRIPPRPAF